MRNSDSHKISVRLEPQPAIQLDLYYNDLHFFHKATQQCTNYSRPSTAPLSTPYTTCQVCTSKGAQFPRVVHSILFCDYSCVCIVPRACCIRQTNRTMPTRSSRLYCSHVEELAYILAFILVHPVAVFVTSSTILRSSDLFKAVLYFSFSCIFFKSYMEGSSIEHHS